MSEWNTGHKCASKKQQQNKCARLGKPFIQIQLPDSTPSLSCTVRHKKRPWRYLGNQERYQNDRKKLTKKILKQIEFSAKVQLFRKFGIFGFYTSLWFFWISHYPIIALWGSCNGEMALGIVHFQDHFKQKCHFHFLIHWVLLKPPLQKIEK